MIFIGGITPGNKNLGITNSFCIVCKKISDLYLSKTYLIFNLFFIPIIYFNISFFAKCQSCNCIMAINKKKGKTLEKDINAKIYKEDLEIVCDHVERNCPNCFAIILSNQNFCHNCGTKL
ncbi:MAG: zinc-ribbon domain-containing protein [Firmicutes bacterium]|nr:zinc-ribbon domain-containing protein [Bacillota bacterium]